MRANWLYFIGTASNPTEVFVYGLSLPTKCDREYYLKDDKGCVGDGKRLFLYRSVNDIGEDDVVKDDEIDFAKIHKSINKKIRKVYHEKFIQGAKSSFFTEGISSPIASLTNITSYYSDDYVCFSALSEESFWNLLTKMSEDTNQDFNGDYVGRIGCLEFGEVFPWAETSVPFGIKSNSKHKYCFFKNYDFKEDLYVLLKVYESKIEKIYEKLVFIPKDITEYLFDFGRNIDWGIKYSIYSANGDIIHDATIVWINSISFNLSPVSPNPICIEDDFTKRDSSIGSISTSNSLLSLIDKDTSTKEIKSFKSRQKKLIMLAEEYHKGNICGKWFSCEKDTLGKIVGYINNILVQNMDVTIVDPYLDVDILQLIIRFNTCVNIKVISVKKYIMADAITKIMTYRDRISKVGLNLNNVKFYVLNEKFHDRFIQFSHDPSNLNKIYSLPNSINAMLKHDDFLMLDLSGEVKIQANNHISKLIKKCDDSKLLKEFSHE